MGIHILVQNSCYYFAFKTIDGSKILNFLSGIQCQMPMQYILGPIWLLAVCQKVLMPIYGHTHFGSYLCYIVFDLNGRGL